MSRVHRFRHRPQERRDVGAGFTLKVGARVKLVTPVLHGRSASKGHGTITVFYPTELYDDRGRRCYEVTWDDGKPTRRYAAEDLRVVDVIEALGGLA
jgi:hypothetical protein